MDTHGALNNLERNKSLQPLELYSELSDLKTFLNHALVANFHLYNLCPFYFAYDRLSLKALLKNLHQKYVHYASGLDYTHFQIV